MIEDKKPRFFYGYAIVLAAFLIMVVAFGTLYSFGVFFKPLLTEFGWSRAAISGAHSLCMILTGALSIVAGRLNDKFGPRLVLTVCGFLLGLGYLLMSQISAIWQLYLFYGVILAIGVSGSFVPLASTVARWFVKRRGMMTGILVSGIGFGMVVMPPIANWLITDYGWRNCYMVVGIVALVLITLASQFLRRDPSKKGQMPYGGSEVKAESSDLQVRGLSFQQAIRTGQFWIFGALLICHLIGQQAILVHIVPHVTDLGISSVIAANILATIGGVTIVGMMVMSSASDRIGNKSALIIAFIVVSIALLWLLVAREVWMLYLFAAVFGFGYGGVVALESPIVAELFGLRSHGLLLGIVMFGAMIGGGIGTIMAGRVFDITNSYQLAFLAGAALSIVSLILVLCLRPSSLKMYH